MTSETLVLIRGAVSVGLNLTATLLSQATTLPLNSAGTVPRGVQLVCNNVSGCHVRLSNTGTPVAGGTDFFISTTPVNLSSKGSRYISWIGDSTVVILSCAPLEIY